MQLEHIQKFMTEQRIDGWLLYDFRGNNPVLAQLLPGKRWTTRRALVLIPARGEARILAHAIDRSQFSKLGVACDSYLSWHELHEWLRSTIAHGSRIAMEYSPGGALPAIAIADAGTIEQLRALGAEVVSSADLIQVTVARWSDEARQKHTQASELVAHIKDEAFAFIGGHIAKNDPVNELLVQRFILDRFAEAGLATAEAPIVAANAHSGDPHFEVSPAAPSSIGASDWVLIDLWARRPGEENIFSDITWVGYVGRDVPDEHRRVFEIVKNARDAALARATLSWSRGERVQGWQLDEAAREIISDAGFEKFIKHRTGHSLSPGPLVHGMGMNLDNLETHDTRAMLPGTGFTIEPGIYLPDFGVRLEINVFVDAQRGPVVTSCMQNEIVRLG